MVSDRTRGAVVVASVEWLEHAAETLGRQKSTWCDAHHRQSMLATGKKCGCDGVYNN